MRIYQKTFLFLSLILLGILTYISILPEYDVFGWAVVLIVVALGAILPKAGTFFRFAFILISGFIALRYIMFRSFYTLDFSSLAAWILGGALYVAELYCMLLHLLGLTVNIAPVKRKTPVYPQKQHTVDVFIPTYDEDVSVSYITALACKNFDYPADKVNVYILNDGSRLTRLNTPATSKAAYARHLELKKMAESAGIHYLTRADGNHAKAGMLNAALSGNAFSDIQKDKTGQYVGGKPIKTTGEFILILDSDHIPTTDFLHETLGYFEQDKKLFLVQTPHFMINKEPLRHNLDIDEKLPAEGWIFYRYIQRSLDRWNATFFCGSAAVLRRSILQKNGGLSGDTVTEDCETALQLHSMGYNSVYVDKPMIAGLEPESVDAMIRQRTRWCQGMLQIFFTKNPLRQKGLKLFQKLSYLNECLFWFFPIFRLIFLLAPLCFLYFQVNVYNASLMQVLYYAGPYFFMALASSYYLYGRYRPFLQSEVFETIQSMALLPAILSVIFNPRKPTFQTTPKGIRTDVDTVSSHSVPFFVLFCLFVFGLVQAVHIYFYYPLFHDAVYLTSFWNIFNLMIVICCIGALFERKQTECFYSFPAFDETIQYNGHSFKMKRLSLSEIILKKQKTTPFAVGQKITLDTIDGKISAMVCATKKQTVQLKIQNEMSQKNVKFVYGHSNRWANIINHYLTQKRIILLPVYLLKQGIKSTLSAFKTVFTRGFSVLIIGLFLTMPAEANTIQFPLDKLIETQNPTIDSVYSEYRFIFHVSKRWNPTGASMTLRYIPKNPIKSSDIDVTAQLNNQSVSAEVTAQTIRVSFPVDVMQSGDNIVFFVIKVTAPNDNCLLTNQSIDLDLAHSFLTIDYTPQPLQDVTLENIYNYQQMGPANVNFIMHDWTLDALKPTLLAASNIAIEVGKRPVNIFFSDTPSPIMDDVLIDNDIDVLYENDYYTLPIRIVNKTPVFRQHIIKPDHIYTFADLGTQTITLRRSKTMQNIQFLIPSTTYLSPNKSLTLNLDMVYGSLFNTEGSLEIYLNDKLFSIVQMDNLQGKNLTNYKAEVPIFYLKKGGNKISFRLDRRYKTDVCINPMDENFFVTIFKDSTLSFPDTKTYLKLPDIGLFFNDGYPFDGNTDLYIDSLTPDKFAAIVHLSSGLAQHRGTTAQKSDLHIGPAVYQGKNTVFFAADNTLPPDTVVFKQSLIPNSNHIHMDIIAQNDETLKNGLETIWQNPNINAVTGSGFTLNTKTGNITPLPPEDSLILTNILPGKSLLYYANNYKPFFVIVFATLAFFIALLLFLTYKGTTDEN